MTYYIPTGDWPLHIEPYRELMQEAGYTEASVDDAHILLLPGGSDLGMRPKRDLEEFRLYEIWTSQRKPVLGICRGLQLMLHMHDGSLIEHIPDVLNECMHTTITGDWRGQSSWHTTQLGLVTNSRHHQGYTKLPDLWEKLDSTHDGIIEAARWRNQFGVQWHPEHQEMKNTAARDWWIMNAQSIVI